MKSAPKFACRAFVAFALLAIVLRVFVPVGFMPADVQAGWYLKWCPDGLSAQTMMAVFGESHQHHSQGTHAQESEQDLAPCDLGGYAADSAFAVQSLATFAVPDAFESGWRSRPQVTAFPLVPFQQRAPPSTDSINPLV